MFSLSLWRQVRYFCLCHFVCTFLRNWEAGVHLSYSSLLLVLQIYYLQKCCLENGCCVDTCAVLFQSWGLKWTLLSRWAAAVGAAPQTLRAPQEAMMTAPAAEARTTALPLLPSLHTSSPTTAGRPLSMEPAGHRGATSSWTPSVSVLSLFWPGRWPVRPEMQLLFILGQNL